MLTCLSLQYKVVILITFYLKKQVCFIFLLSVTFIFTRKKNHIAILLFYRFPDRFYKSEPSTYKTDFSKMTTTGNQHTTYLYTCNTYAWKISSLSDTEGNILERYIFSLQYGQVSFLPLNISQKRDKI